MTISHVRCCNNSAGRGAEADCGSEEEREVSDLGELLHRKKHRRILTQEQERDKPAGTQAHSSVPVPVPEPEHQAHRNEQ